MPDGFNWDLVPWLGVIGGILACLTAFLLVMWVLRQGTGNDKMREIALAIQEGANAYMRRQYLTIGVFAVVIFVILAWALDWPSAIGFAVGAILSGLAGLIGMWISVRANVRTAHAAASGLGKALDVAFRGGAVTGLFVVGFGLLGVAGFFGVIVATHDGPMDYQKVVASLIGLGFGASLISLFARMGGGIYTKAADVGADLVGKVVAGIPEDDPRNPAVIADNVGDNVGDCAGMGADLFETYAVTAIAAMLIGAVITPSVGMDADAGMILTILPLLLGSIAIVASVISIFFVRLSKNSTNVMGALYKGLIAAVVITAIGFSAAIMLLLPDKGVYVSTSALPDLAQWQYTGTEQTFEDETFLALNKLPILLSALIGLLVMVAMFVITEYYTGTGHRPVKGIASASEKGAATNIISGIAVGLEATILPVLVIIAGILGAYFIGGLYGVATAALAMLSMTGIVVALDSFGPITDNGGGIAEMAGLPDDVRKSTDLLDAVGNTTKAVTKGYAIGSAGLAALALFYAFRYEIIPYVEKLQQDFPAFELSFTLENPFIIVGLLLGAMIPFAFGALSMRAVGRAAESVIAEVQRQFKEIPGIMEGTARPQYDRCVSIVTRAALIQMIAPALLPVITPILVFLLEWVFPGQGAGIHTMGGVLIGSIVGGLLLALHMTAGGGAWDNAKKLIEDGNHGGKGSEAHKAAVIGDTVGDPYKDTAGPAFNPLIKILNIVAILAALILASSAGN